MSKNGNAKYAANILSFSNHTHTHIHAHWIRMYIRCAPVYHVWAIEVQVAMLVLVVILTLLSMVRVARNTCKSHYGFVYAPFLKSIAINVHVRIHNLMYVHTYTRISTHTKEFTGKCNWAHSKRVFCCCIGYFLRIFVFARMLGDYILSLHNSSSSSSSTTTTYAPTKSSIEHIFSFHWRALISRASRVCESIKHRE